MEGFQCFYSGCERVPEHVCRCASNPTFMCSAHMSKHMKIAAALHQIERIHAPPIAESKNVIIRLLNAEKTDLNVIKTKILQRFSANFVDVESIITQGLAQLDRDIKDLENVILQVISTNQVSKYENNPVLSCLILSPRDAHDKFIGLLPSRTVKYDKLIKYAYIYDGEIENVIGNIIDIKISEVLERLTKTEKFSQAMAEKSIEYSQIVLEQSRQFNEFIGKVDAVGEEVKSHKEFLRNHENWMVATSATINEINDKMHLNLADSLGKISVVEEEIKINKELLKRHEEWMGSTSVSIRDINEIMRSTLNDTNNSSKKVSALEEEVKNQKEFIKHHDDWMGSTSVTINDLIEKVYSNINDTKLSNERSNQMFKNFENAIVSMKSEIERIFGAQKEQERKENIEKVTIIEKQCYTLKKCIEEQEKKISKIIWEIGESLNQRTELDRKQLDEKILAIEQTTTSQSQKIGNQKEKISQLKADFESQISFVRQLGDQMNLITKSLKEADAKAAISTQNLNNQNTQNASILSQLSTEIASFKGEVKKTLEEQKKINELRASGLEERNTSLNNETIKEIANLRAETNQFLAKQREEDTIIMNQLAENLSSRIDKTSSQLSSFKTEVYEILETQKDKNNQVLSEKLLSFEQRSLEQIAKLNEHQEKFNLMKDEIKAQTDTLKSYNTIIAPISASFNEMVAKISFNTNEIKRYKELIDSSLVTLTVEEAEIKQGIVKQDEKIENIKQEFIEKVNQISLALPEGNSVMSTDPFGKLKKSIMCMTSEDEQLKMFGLKIRDLMIFENELDRLDSQIIFSEMNQECITWSFFDEISQQKIKIQDLYCRLEKLTKEYESVSYLYAKSEETKCLCDLSGEIAKTFNEYSDRYTGVVAKYEEMMKRSHIFYEMVKMKEYEYNIYADKYIYLTEREKTKTKLIIFDSELQKRDFVYIDTPEPLCCFTSITQLPNYELFCFGNWNPLSGITCIIDSKYNVRVLPSGTPCNKAGSVYYQNNVYVFGGSDNKKDLALAEAYDLVENKWIKLNPLPAPSRRCSCIVYKQNIIITGFNYSKLYSYSIIQNSYTEISSLLVRSGGNKILVSGIFRLFLIESSGAIYESEVGDENNWKKVAISNLSNNPEQIYRAYREGSIYVGFLNTDGFYKFGLDDKKFEKIQGIEIGQAPPSSIG
ncbi:unnamed protein product [Blepharisma stoltei]|uniref:Uncharacterized protein n=1 Tax=Blepharisma stoltei TaxID=1481888 RepID=A0AAU9IZJ8_9CILI|nr:unnamed protein product [Blepharisma stoltei]